MGSDGIQHESRSDRQALGFAHSDFGDTYSTIDGSRCEEIHQLTHYQSFLFLFGIDFVVTFASVVVVGGWGKYRGNNGWVMKGEK